MDIVYNSVCLYLLEIDIITKLFVEDKYRKVFHIVW